MIFVGIAVRIEYLFPRVDRGVVRLVVYEEKRQLGNDLEPGLWRYSVGDMVASYPLQKFGQNRLVLLDHEQPGTLLWRNRKMVCYSGVEVAVFSPRGGAVGMNLRITIFRENADWVSWLPVWRSLVAQKRFFETDLGLGAQIVVQAGQYNDDLVACVGCLAD